MKIAIIGLGVLGAGTARALTRLGAQVTVFERTAPGAGTSGTSYGWINAHRKQPRSYHELNVAGMAEHEALRRHGCDWYVRSGLLEWASDEAGHDRLVANAARLRKYDYPVETITRARAAELAPDLLIPPGVDELAWYPTEGYALPIALLARLWGEARDRGAELRCPVEVCAVEPVGDGARVHVVGGEPERFDRVVIAVGRWTGELTRAIVPTIPMLGPQDPALPGLLACTAPLAARVPFPVITPELNFRPDGGGRLLVAALDLNADVVGSGLSSDVGPGRRYEPDQAFVSELSRRLGTLLRGGEYARIDRVDLGLRSLPADGHTVAGADDSGQIYILATHSGITLGPLLGRLAAQEIVRERLAPELGDFRPQRFLGTSAFPSVAPARLAGEQ